MTKDKLHFEPYVHLADLTPTTAVIAWGGFYFYRSLFTGSWTLTHDHQLKKFGIDRTQTIGAGSEPYGNARVTIFDSNDEVVAVKSTRDSNHVLIEGLNPDTEYRYKIELNNRDFVTGPLYDCAFDASGRFQGLKQSNGCYDLRFRTFPADDVEAPLNFAVLGDYGVGIHRLVGGGYRQRIIAEALALAVDDYDIRLVVTTGDNIYKDIMRRSGTGGEDDDWFYAFYQPYRYLLSRIPFYPTVGNHDSGDAEERKDRLQLIDNFYLQHRFRNGQIASLEPGLVYRFRFGKLINFLCADSSFHEETGERFTQLPEYRKFIERALSPIDDGTKDGTKEVPHWNIVFAHHPPYCAGPEYGNDEAMLESIVPLLEHAAEQTSSGCVMLSGHEHNFQYARARGVDYFITGAAGKLRLAPPTEFATAHTRAWASAPHFLLIEISSRHLSATPLGLTTGNRLLPLHLRDPQGKTLRAPLLISRTRPR